MGIERLKVKGEGSTRLTHWVPWGTATPKDRDEVNKREVVTESVMGERVI
jgi:hypothetical protein